MRYAHVNGCRRRPVDSAGLIAWALAAALVAAMLLAGCGGGQEVRQALAKTTPERTTVAKTALSKVGDGYAANMAGPDLFDDAGLAYYAYRRNGHALPRSLAAQLDAGTPIPLSEARPGDLVFFRIEAPTGPARLVVGVIIDRQLAVIALPGSGQGSDRGSDRGSGGVRRVSLDKGYWAERLVGVSRVLPDAAGASHT